MKPEFRPFILQSGVQNLRSLPRFPPKLAKHLSRSLVALAAALTLGESTPAHAILYYWDTTTTGLWGNGANWSDDPTSGGNTGFVPLSTDSAIFNQSSVNGAEVVQLGGATSIAGITFANTGTTTIQSSSTTSQALTIGTTGITINAGAGAVTIGNATNGAPITLGGVQTWTNNSANTFTAVNALSMGANALTINGTGATTVSGLTTGTVATGTVGLTIGGTATVSLTSGSNTFTGDIAINGAGATLVYSGGTVTTASQLGRGSSTNYKQVLLTNGGTFRVTTTDYNVNVPTATNLAAGQVFNIGTGGGTFEVASGRSFTLDDGTVTSGTGFTSAQLQGTGTLTKTGAGTLTLGNTGTTFAGFTGLIQVNAGILKLGAATAAGVPLGATSAGTVIASGAAFDINNNASTSAEPLNISGAGIGGTGNVILSSNAAAGSFAGPITLAADSTIGATAAGTMTLSGGVTGAFNLTINNTAGGGTTLSGATVNPAGKITNSGTGTGKTTISAVIGTNLNAFNVIQNSATSNLVLSGLNLYTSQTQILNGVLEVNVLDAGAAGTGGPLGAVPATVTPASILINGGTLQESVATLTLNANRGIVLGPSANNRIVANNGNFGYAGIIADQSTPASLTIGSGSGVWVPGGQFTYSGGTTLATGSVTVPTASSTGAGPTSGPFGTGTLTLAGGQMRSTSANAISLANAVTISADTTFTSVASEKDLTFSGAVTLAGGTRTLTVNTGTSVAGRALTFNGAIGDGGSNFGLTQAGTGTLILGGANTYGGATTINAGTLALASTGSLANPTVTAQTGGTFQIRGNNTIGGATTPVITIAGNTTPATAGTLSLIDGAPNTLTLNTATPATPALVLGGAAGSPANLSLEVGATSDQIIFAGTTQATVNAGGALVNIAGLGGLSGTNQILIASPTTDLTTGGAFTLGTISGNTSNYLLSLSTSANALTLVETPNVSAAAAALWFKGNLGNSWAQTNGANASNNFTTDAAGTAAATQLPGSNTVVRFYATGATTGNLATTLNQDFTIDSLVAEATATTASSIAPGTPAGTLTLAPASSANGILINTGAAAFTISAPVVLGADQTWTNNATTALTVSGNITGGSKLTLNGTSTGAITLSGVNTYSGDTLLTAGTISFAPTVAGTSLGNIKGNAAAGTVVLGLAGTSTAAITGVISDGTLGGKLAVTKSAAGTWTLAGANTYSGATTISAGILQLQGTIANSAISMATNTTLQVRNDGPGSNGILNYGNPIQVTATGPTFDVGNNGGTNTGNTVAFGALAAPTTATVNTMNFLGANGYNLSFTSLALVGATGATTTLNPTTTSVTILGNVTNPMSGFATTNFDTLGLDGTSIGNLIQGNVLDNPSGAFTPTLLGGYTKVLKTNTSTWTLAGSGSAWTGTTIVQNGTLKSGVDNAIPTTNLQGVSIPATGAGVTATYDFNGFDQTLNTVNGTGTALTLSGTTATSRPQVLGADSTVTINGGVTYTSTNNPLGGVISVADLDLGGGTRTFNVGLSTSAGTVALPDLAVSSNLSNGTLTKSGAGVLALTGSLNLSGIFDPVGTISITSATTLNSTPVTVNGGTFDLGGTTQNVANFSLTSGSIVNGTLSGVGNILKQGPGTMSLGVASTGIGSVTVNQGPLPTTSSPASLSTLNLNFAAAGAPATNLINGTANLILGGTATNLVGGGALSLTGAASGTNSQTFATTLIDGGSSAAQLTIGTGGTLALNLGTLTRNTAGTVDLTLPANAQSATNGVTLGNPGTAGTLLTDANGTAFGTVSGNDWASNSTVSPGNIVGASVAGAGGASIYTTYATAPGSLTGNADITGSFTAPTTQTVNSLRFNTGTFTLTLAGTNTISTGGVLFGSGSSGATITGGTIAPGAGGELVFIGGKNATLTIASVIGDVAGGASVTYSETPSAVVAAGGVGFQINGANTYTGPTYVNSGRVTAGNSQAFGTGAGAIVYVDGNTDGQVYVSSSIGIANPFVITGTGWNEAGTRRGVLRLEGGASLNGSVTMLGDSTVHNNTGNNIGNIAGPIGGAFTLTKAGAGIIKLSGTNSHAATNIAAGVLNINADAALGAVSAPLTFTGASTLQFQNAITLPVTRSIVLNATGTFDTSTTAASASTTISGVISGTGALVKSYATQGAATNPLILSGLNTFTGNVNATSGWLTATNSSSFGTGTKSISATTNQSSDSIHLDPGAGPAIDFPANMSFTTSNDTFTAVNEGTISNDSGNNIIRGTVTLTSGGGGTIFASKAGTITFAGNITPSATLRALKLRGNGAGVISGIIADGTTVQLPITRDLGTGTWTLSGANTYGGETTISSGGLKIGNVRALGTQLTILPATITTGTTVASGTVLDLNGTAGVTERIILNGTGVGGGGALINSNTGAAATITDSLASVGITTPTGASSTTVTVAGGSGAAATANLGVTAASFTINGGTTVYSVAPTVAIAGGTAATATAVLTAGVVSGITVTAAGTNFATAPTITFSGGTVTTAGTNPTGTGNATNFTINNITITNPGSGFASNPVLTDGTAVIAAVASQVQLATTSSIGGAGDLTINGFVTGTGTAGLTKVGAGTLTLAGANTFSGDLNIDGGTLVANRGNNSLNPTFSALGNPRVARNINVNNGGTLMFTAGDTLGGNDSSVLATLVINAGGLVTNTPFFNTFGPVQLNGGTLTGTGGAVNDFQMYSLQGTVTVGGTSASTISGSGAFAGYHLSANTTFNVADATGNANSDLNVSGLLIDRQAALGAGGLTKSGAGTMALSGANGYTGPTNVTAGTLLINGLQGSATGAVTVSTGATLGGTGTIGGAVTIQTGGNLKPGASAGLLTLTNNLTLGGDTTNSTFEIQGATRGTVGGYDAIDLGASSLLTYDGVLTLDISGTITDGTYDLFAFTAAPTGSFDQVTLIGSGGYTGNLTNNSGIWTGDSQATTFTFTQATGDLMVVTVPEPSALVSLLGGLGILLGFRRSRRP